MIFYAYCLLNDHTSAIKCGRKLLVFLRDRGLRAKEGELLFQLAKLYQLPGKYKEAIRLYKKALSIMIETGVKEGEAACYGHLGRMSESLGEYRKAEEYQKKALATRKEIGDQNGEATCYGDLGVVYHSLGEYAKAEEYLNKALAIKKEIGDKVGEAACYGNLGGVCESLGELDKAEKYQSKALAITKEIGDKQGEAVWCANLGRVYRCLGEYQKAEAYQKKALAIRRRIGYKKGEAMSYINLGNLYTHLGEYAKAEDYLNSAVVIFKEIGDKAGKAACYRNLGHVSRSLSEYEKAEEYQKKVLAISKQIGDKKGEALCYTSLGTIHVYHSVGEYTNAEKYLNNALAINREIGRKNGEAACYGLLGSLSRSLGKHPEAKQYHEKALAMSREIGDIEAEAEWHLHLAGDALSEGNPDLQDQIFSNFSANIEKCEKMRSSLGRNDQIKISFLEKHSVPYHSLSTLFCLTGKNKEAVCLLELGRARALADLISGHYSAEQQISVNSPSWADIETMVKKERNCSCLYISYFEQNMFLWVIKGNKPTRFRKIDVNKCFVSKGLKRDVHQDFGEESFRGYKGLQEHCEDRSLSVLKASDSIREPGEEESLQLAEHRPVEEEEEEDLELLLTLAERYQMIIAPVADCLDQPELMIVPDRVLYKVPFAALKDENGNCLSEAYRIRIVPSLTTLGVIHNSPADYHSQTGALIVGDPDVRDVYYKGRLGELSRLPSAKD